MMFNNLTAMHVQMFHIHPNTIMYVTIVIRNPTKVKWYFYTPDKMSEQPQRYSDIMKFWSDIDRNYIVFIIQLPHKLVFGQTTNKNGRK